MGSKKLPVIPPERQDDLHHLEFAYSADLILFMAGNQFMAMDEIVRAFRKKHPRVEKIFYETLPPGLELKQILAGAAIFRNKKLDVYPDVYSSVSENGMRVLEEKDHIRKGDYHLYLHNRLCLMVPAGNPAGIRSVADLARDEVRISQPDPQNEDIAFHIIDMYRQAGGDELVRRIMREKRAQGTTILTKVHHRETPERIINKTVDVGPVWATEVIHAKAQGLDVDGVEPGEALDQRDRINYYVCAMKNAPNPENASKFLEFIRMPIAQKIFGKYGFVPHLAA